MRKLIVFILTMVLVLGLMACAAEEQEWDVSSMQLF